jgi:cytochrome b subunit of formate dehydrogenase
MSNPIPRAASMQHPIRRSLPALALLCAASIAMVLATPRAKAEEPSANPDNAACLGCHGAAGFEAPRADGKTRPLSVAEESFAASVHGKTLNCVDCHAMQASVPHTAVTKSAAEWREQTLAINRNCVNCHSEAQKSYVQTHHGKVAALGFADTASCSDCHGSHAILHPSDPASRVSTGKVLAMCRECHVDATAGFATFQPHATTNDFARYPYTWVTSKFLLAMIVSALGLFWIHSALWFWRELRDRQQAKPRPQVRIEAVPPLKGDHVHRWSGMWRIAHLAFAASVIGLTATGIPLLYPNTAWAPVIEQWLGGPAMVSALHKWTGVVMLAIFVWHILYVAVHLAREWKEFKLFGPYSLLPTWQDAWDIAAMCKWFVGRGPRPVFDHWWYMQKVDYWAPFWGIFMLTVSGAMLWFKNITADYLPGWAFNVATILHGEEALLAAVYLFTIHYFSTHWRPDKFPLDLVMFTGTIPLDEFQRDYGVEYRRLVESGKISSYVVEAPSSPMTLGSRILGFSLVIAGLVLLVMMADGFFGNLLKG